MPSKALRPLSSTCLFHCASVRPARAGVCVSRSPLCPVTTTCPGRSQRGERPPCPLARADLASVSHGLLTYGKPGRPRKPALGQVLWGQCRLLAKLAVPVTHPCETLKEFSRCKISLANPSPIFQVEVPTHREMKYFNPKSQS